MTPVTVHQVLVLYVGLCYFISGVLIFTMWELLGPRYKDHWTLGPKRRAVLFLLALGAVLRGSTFFFPGQLVATDKVSVLLPWWTTILLVASVTFTEMLTGQRLPPPVMARVGHLLRTANTAHSAAINIAMSSAPAETYLGEALGPDPQAVRFSGAKLRHAVIGASVLGLLIVLCVVLHAAAATLPAH